MIRRSFCFLPGCSENLEKSIWSQGVRDWQGFLEREHIKGISKKRKAFYDRRILEAREHLDNGDCTYFRDIPSRLYEDFRQEAIYLDIEASGHDKGFITVVGIYDGRDVMQFVKSINLDWQEIARIISRSKLIISFNGSSYDLPKLVRDRPLPDLPHLDLRHACRRAGLSGGLKEIEKQLGIRRDPAAAAVGGGDPYRLWQRWRATGDKDYLDLLLKYNEEDCVNLEMIARKLLVSHPNNYILV